jgi:hypothetical protein
VRDLEERGAITRRRDNSMHGTCFVLLSFIVIFGLSALNLSIIGHNYFVRSAERTIRQGGVVLMHETGIFTSLPAYWRRMLGNDIKLPDFCLIASWGSCKSNSLKKY